MNDTPTQLPTPPAGTPLNRDALMLALSLRTRWAILDVLSNGEGYGVADLEPILKTARSNISKQIMILKEAGIVTMGRGRLYYIASQFNPNPGSRVLDFGHCILRLDAQPAA